MQMITEGRFFFLLFFFFKHTLELYSSDISFQPHAGVSNSLITNRLEARGPCIPRVLVRVQLRGRAAITGRGSRAAVPTRMLKWKLRVKAPVGPENTDSVAHQEWIIFPVLFLLVSVPSWKAASCPNSSWGQSGASLLR